MTLIITRPEEDAQALMSKLAGMGRSATAMPLLKIVPRTDVVVPSNSYQAICVTSANALKTPGIVDQFKNIPLLAVGPQSLDAARQAGFTKASAHGGDVHGLSAHVKANFDPKAGALLYISGAETSADLQAILQASGFTVERVIAYDAVMQKPAGLENALKQADGVLLYSPRTARIWRDLVAGLENAAARPIYYCLSENVAKILPQHWRKRVAKTPDESAMLALLD
jgi:uroporphyrinogen-III synthase